MTALELLQLVVCLLFPLGLLALLTWNIGRLKGRTPREIALTCLVFAAAVLGVVGIGWGLSASRGYPLIEYGSGSIGVGRFRAVDGLGLLACAALIAVAMVAARRLSGSGARTGGGSGEQPPP